MKKAILKIAAFTAVLLLVFRGASAQKAEDEQMRIKLSFDDKEIIVRMEDNSAAKQLIALLPTEFEFRDYAGSEKITYFKTPLSLKDAPTGLIPLAGKMFIYAPWGNMGFFYKNHGIMPDRNLIPLGTIESGLEQLAAMNNNFTAKLELIK